LVCYFDLGIFSVIEADRRVKLGANIVTTALPAVLAHSELIRLSAMIMSIAGGLLIYGTIISFSMFFQEEQEF
jgi:hypothetical protein